MSRTAPTTNFALRLPTDEYEILRAEAAATGTSINAICCRIIHQHVLANRNDLIDAIAKSAAERYAVVLDKLAHL